MAQRPRHYFLAASGNPPEGPIKLGNIITTPRQVDDPINEGSLPLDSVPGIELFEHNEYNYNLDMDTNDGGKVGIWASFLQMLGIGGDLKVEGSEDGSEQWQCERLQTLSFTPKLAYIVKCLEDTGVQDYLRVSKPWIGASKLFMVTGVKIAYGASSTVRWAQERGLSLHLGADLTGLGVPLQIGPDATRSKSVSVLQSHDNATPFVFAFRLRRIKIAASGSIEHKQYDRGAMLSLDDKEDDTGAKFGIVVEGIEDQDADGSDFQLERKEAIDGASTNGASCICIPVLEDR